MKTLLRSIAVTVLILLFSPILFAQTTYSVKIVVKGLTERQGKMFAALSSDPAKFPTTNGIKNTSVEVKGEGEVILTFTDVPEGKYAILLFQDLNGNNQLDMNGQMPAEPFGFSNLTNLMGPPDFSECAFTVNENKVIEIGLFSL